MVARLDSSNEMADLVLDIQEAVSRAADEKAKAALLRRIRRALSADGSGGGDRRRPPISGYRAAAAAGMKAEAGVACGFQFHR